jgi:hypothetical protein
VQLYLKHGTTFTTAHNELGYSSAINVMAADSKGEEVVDLELPMYVSLLPSLGAAVWVGFFFRDLIQHYGLKQIAEMMVGACC